VPLVQPALLREVASSGLAALRLAGWLPGPRGIWHFAADRPGEGWHAHGSYIAGLGDLKEGRLVELRVRKPRWLEVATNTTVHTDPPGDLGLRYSGLVVALQLLVWIDGALGLHRFSALFPDLDVRPHRRTVQRWLARLRPHGLELQHGARRALLRRFDTPRSLDTLFPGGLSPPPTRRRRPWREPETVWQLARALVMVLGAAMALEVPAALLMTEAWWKVEHRARQTR